MVACQCCMGTPSYGEGRSRLVPHVQLLAGTVILSAMVSSLAGGCSGMSGSSSSSKISNRLFLPVWH